VKYKINLTKAFYSSQELIITNRVVKPQIALMGFALRTKIEE
jgi:hypothetical protein